MINIYVQIFVQKLFKLFYDDQSGSKSLLRDYSGRALSSPLSVSLGSLSLCDTPSLSPCVCVCAFVYIYVADLKGEMFQVGLENLK